MSRALLLGILVVLAIIAAIMGKNLYDRWQTEKALAWQRQLDGYRKVCFDKTPNPSPATLEWRRSNCEWAKNMTMTGKAEP